MRLQSLYKVEYIVAILVLLRNKCMFFSLEGASCVLQGVKVENMREISRMDHFDRSVAAWTRGGGRAGWRVWQPVDGVEVPAGGNGSKRLDDRTFLVSWEYNPV